jgi:hypothetical protein
MRADDAGILLRCMSLQLADFVVKVQNCPVIIFPPEVDPSDGRRFV